MRGAVDVDDGHATSIITARKPTILVAHPVENPYDSTWVSDGFPQAVTRSCQHIPEATEERIKTSQVELHLHHAIPSRPSHVLHTPIPYTSMYTVCMHAWYRIKTSKPRKGGYTQQKRLS